MNATASAQAPTLNGPRLRLHDVLNQMISAIPDEDTRTTAIVAGLQALRHAAEFGPPGLKEDILYEAILIALNVFPESPLDVQPWMIHINKLLIEYHRQERGYPVRDVPKPPSVEAVAGSWRDRPKLL
jgi:hypothetical protein